MGYYFWGVVFFSVGFFVSVGLRSGPVWGRLKPSLFSFSSLLPSASLSFSLPRAPRLPDFLHRASRHPAAQGPPDWSRSDPCLLLFLPGPVPAPGKPPSGGNPLGDADCSFAGTLSSCRHSRRALAQKKALIPCSNPSKGLPPSQTR